jgi:Family of unknown function (DUF5309)
VALLGERFVKNASDETTLKRDVDDSLVRLEPDAAPLYVLTNNKKRTAPSMVPKFEWLEDAEAPLWGQASNSTDYASNATVIAVADATIFAVDDLLLIPQATGAGKSAAEEVVLVTAVGVAGNTLTITRGIGGAGADTITATSPIRILGQACVEASGVPTIRSTQKVPKTSYCQLFKTPVKTSEHVQASEFYAAPQGERRYQQAVALVRHRSEIEAAGLWGRGSESLSASGSRWTTQGVKPTISTNITDASTTLSYTSMLKFGEAGFRYGEKSKLCMAGPSVLSAFDFFSANKLLTNVLADVYGVQIKKIVTNHGTYLIANNFRMEAGIAGAAGFNDELYLIDLPSVVFRYLNGNGKSMNTKLLEDIVKDGSDQTVDEFKSIVGWQVKFEKKHARMYNVTAFA